MADFDTKTVLDVVEILKGLKTLLADNPNPYLPVYSALGGAFVGAIATFFPNYMIECLKTRRERKSLTLAIYAEIKATLELMRLRSYVEDAKNLITKLREGVIPPTTYQIIFPDDYCIVYKNNISKIGILDPNLQIHIVQFYQLLEGVIQDVKPGGLLNSKPSGVDIFESVLAVTEQMIEHGSMIIKKIENIYGLYTGTVK